MKHHLFTHTKGKIKRVIRQFIMGSLLVLSITPFILNNQVVAKEEGWTTKQLAFFFIDYPKDWKIETSNKGDYVAIYPPENDTLNGNRIEIAFLGYELPTFQNLQDWYAMYYRAAHGEPPLEFTVLEHHSFAHENNRGIWQKIHVAITNALGPSQAVMLAHGNLVLSVGTYTHEPTMTEILAKVADSVRFTADAPRTFQELHNTNEAHPSLEAVLAAIQRGGIVSEDIVTRDARASEALPILPPSTPSPEFLEIERQYQKWLEQHGLPQGGGGATQF